MREYHLQERSAHQENVKSDWNCSQYWYILLPSSPKFVESRPNAPVPTGVPPHLGPAAKSVFVGDASLTRAEFLGNHSP